MLGGEKGLLLRRRINPLLLFRAQWMRQVDDLVIGIIHDRLGENFTVEIGAANRATLPGKPSPAQQLEGRVFFTLFLLFVIIAVVIIIVIIAAAAAAVVVTNIISRFFFLL